jgi:hypothetical protein
VRSARGRCEWPRVQAARWTLPERLTDARMLTLIRPIRAGLKGVYGSPRIWREIKDRRVGEGMVSAALKTGTDPSRGSW